LHPIPPLAELYPLFGDEVSHLYDILSPLQISPPTGGRLKTPKVLRALKYFIFKELFEK
jgi:hypothetical protein